MDWKAQHNKDVSSSQIDIQVYNNSYKTSAGFFFVDIDKIIIKYLWKDRKTGLAKYKKN